MANEFWLSDSAWAAIEPLLPKNQPGARRVADHPFRRDCVTCQQDRKQRRQCRRLRLREGDIRPLLGIIRAMVKTRHEAVNLQDLAQKAPGEPKEHLSPSVNRQDSRR